MPERTRFATLLAFVLIGIGAWRAYAVVGATPLLGYANQFDMRRISACVGLWRDLPSAARLQVHPEAPIARYVRGERRPDECYWSSELLFVAPVAATLAAGETVDLRVIGAIKAATLVLIAFALGAMLRRRPAFALVHAVVFAFVLCDPIVTLWLNTLYTEFTALLFAYASVVLLVAIGARANTSNPPPSTQVAALAMSLIGLGLSRQQHLWLPALLLLPLVISLWARARRSALLLVAVVGAIAFAQAELIGRHPTIAQANSADVVLGAILPASKDEALTAKRLGLPERCLRSVGATWYEPMGEELESTCPEAMTSASAWVDATLPLPFARALFLIAIVALLALGTVACWRRRASWASWLAVAISALLSIVLLLPHLSALAANGEQGRLFYTTSALLALLVGLAVAATVARSGAQWRWGRRATVLGASLVLIAAELLLLRATVAPWSAAGAQARALIIALPGIASEISGAGYGFVLVPDHLGSVPFGRNAQGGLMLPPTQPLALSSRLIVQTPADLPAWPANAQRGLVDALRRYPLAQVWSAVASGQANGTALPTDYFCWAENRSRIVRLSLPVSAAQGNWPGAWQHALAESPCAEVAAELERR